ncbi:helix-turn-helix domain-containing protein [Novosphingobium sp. BL-8A]|uniref:helix-turn-helix domain-containing protein n=1 Tax=Novosphingobium sp. BL-8A TaxID=3127639 RepID=UPI003757F802
MGEMVTIPIEEYKALKEAAEDLADIRASERVKAAVERGDDEYVPAELVNRILAGESPLRVWREHRGLTQLALSDRAGVGRAQIAQIEGGRQSGSIQTLQKLANALRVPIDDLLIEESMGSRILFPEGEPDWFRDELNDLLDGAKIVSYSISGDTYVIHTKQFSKRLPDALYSLLVRAGAKAELVSLDV